MQILAYGTFGLWIPLKCHPGKLLIRQFNRHALLEFACIRALKSCEFLPMNLS